MFSLLYWIILVWKITSHLSEIQFTLTMKIAPSLIPMSLKNFPRLCSRHRLLQLQIYCEDLR